MDEINLKLPAKPEYVSVIRLTTAAIANRLGFSIDEIEDLKVAVSEAAIYLINQFSMFSLLAVDYHIQDNCSVTATVTAIGASGLNASEGKETELSLFIIESVADKITRHIENGVIKGFSIYKTGGGNFE